MTNEDYMMLAVNKARQGIEAGQTPFGASIIKNGEVIACSHNRVWKETDPTAHAEINAIREAAKKIQSIDLGGSVMFTTCEPCPMCLTAIHWSKIEVVYYGATIADAESAGFQELRMPAKELAQKGGSLLKVERGPCIQECVALFRKWKDAGKNSSY